MEREYAYHSYVRFEIRVQRRDELRRFLEEQGIQTSVHYPTPIHLDRVYRERYGVVCQNSADAKQHLVGWRLPEVR